MEGGINKNTNVVEPIKIPMGFMGLSRHFAAFSQNILERYAIWERYPWSDAVIRYLENKKQEEASQEGERSSFFVTLQLLKIYLMNEREKGKREDKAQEADTAELILRIEAELNGLKAGYDRCFGILERLYREGAQMPEEELAGIWARLEKEVGARKERYKSREVQVRGSIIPHALGMSESRLRRMVEGHTYIPNGKELFRGSVARQQREFYTKLVRDYVVRETARQAEYGMGRKLLPSEQEALKDYGDGLGRDELAFFVRKNDARLYQNAADFALRQPTDSAKRMAFLLSELPVWVSRRAVRELMGEGMEAGLRQAAKPQGHEEVAKGHMDAGADDKGSVFKDASRDVGSENMRLSELWERSSQEEKARLLHRIPQAIRQAASRWEETGRENGDSRQAEALKAVIAKIEALQGREAEAVRGRKELQESEVQGREGLRESAAQGRAEAAQGREGVREAETQGRVEAAQGRGGLREAEEPGRVEAAQGREGLRESEEPGRAEAAQGRERAREAEAPGEAEAAQGRGGLRESAAQGREGLREAEEPGRAEAAQGRGGLREAEEPGRAEAVRGRKELQESAAQGREGLRESEAPGRAEAAQGRERVRESEAPGGAEAAQGRERVRESEALEGRGGLSEPELDDGIMAAQKISEEMNQILSDLPVWISQKVVQELLPQMNEEKQELSLLQGDAENLVYRQENRNSDLAEDGTAEIVKTIVGRIEAMRKSNLVQGHGMLQGAEETQEKENIRLSEIWEQSTQEEKIKLLHRIPQAIRQAASLWEEAGQGNRQGDSRVNGDFAQAEMLKIMVKKMEAVQALGTTQSSAIAQRVNAVQKLENMQGIKAAQGVQAPQKLGPVREQELAQGMEKLLETRALQRAVSERKPGAVQGLETVQVTESEALQGKEGVQESEALQGREELLEAEALQGGKGVQGSETERAELSESELENGIRVAQRISEEMNQILSDLPAWISQKAVQELLPQMNEEKLELSLLQGDVENLVYRQENRDFDLAEDGTAEMVKTIVGRIEAMRKSNLIQGYGMLRGEEAQEKEKIQLSELWEQSTQEEKIKLLHRIPQAIRQAASLWEEAGQGNKQGDSRGNSQADGDFARAEMLKTMVKRMEAVQALGTAQGSAMAQRINAAQKPEIAQGTKPAKEAGALREAELKPGAVQGLLHRIPQAVRQAASLWEEAGQVNNGGDGRGGEGFRQAQILRTMVERIEAVQSLVTVQRIEAVQKLFGQNVSAGLEYLRPELPAWISKAVSRERYASSGIGKRNWPEPRTREGFPVGEGLRADAEIYYGADSEMGLDRSWDFQYTVRGNGDIIYADNAPKSQKASPNEDNAQAIQELESRISRQEYIIRQEQIEREEIRRMMKKQRQDSRNGDSVKLEDMEITARQGSALSQKTFLQLKEQLRLERIRCGAD